MGLRELFKAPPGHAERLIRAFERMAAASERGNRGFFAPGRPQELSDKSQQVFYTSDEEEALREVERFTYEQQTGRKLGDWEDPPGPENPATGLPWGYEEASEEGEEPE
jgi:hypothetical protein